MLTLSIERRSSLVKQKKFWLPYQCTCNGYSLLLASRKLDTALSYDSVVPEREQVLVVDKIIGIRLTASIVHKLNNFI